jgi:hypothetical protein
MSSLFKRSNGIYYICYDENRTRKWKSTRQTRLADALHELAQFTRLPKEYKPRDTIQSFSKDFLARNQVSYLAKTLDLYKRSLNLLAQLVGKKLLSSFTHF